MNWDAARIKGLRRRLGWTQAELSRRLGVKIESIQAWESGHGAPAMESMNQLASLESHVEAYATSIAGSPVAEEVLSGHKLNQIQVKDLHRFTGRS